MKLITNDAGGRTLYLHQSDITDLRMCPEQARLKLSGEYFDPPSDVAMIGTRTHSFIEWCLHEYQDVGGWPANPQRQLNIESDTLRRDWPTLWTKPHMVRGIDHAIEALESCCVRWYNQVLPLIDTKHPELWEIEQRFDVLVLQQGNDQIRLRGARDFWDGTVIWDWKTGGYSSRDRWKKERYDPQPVVYTYAKAFDLGYPRLKGEDLDPVCFNFAFMPRDVEETHIVDLAFGPNDWDHMLLEVISWGKTILTLGPDHEWPLGPSDWWCSPRWCSEFALGRCRGEFSDGWWPDEVNTIIELKAKTDAGLVPWPAEHHVEL